MFNFIILVTLKEIRAIYENFKRQTIFPFIEITVFCHIVPFKRISSIFIFNEFTKKQSLFFFIRLYEFL